MQAWTFANSQCKMPLECKNIRVAVPIEIKSPLIPAVHPVAAHQASVLNSCKPLKWREWLWKTCAVLDVSRPLDLRGSASCIVFSSPLLPYRPQPPVLVKWLQQQKLLDWLPKQCLNTRGSKQIPLNLILLFVFLIIASTNLPSAAIKLSGCQWSRSLCDLFIFHPLHPSAPREALSERLNVAVGNSAISALGSLRRVDALVSW